MVANVAGAKACIECVGAGSLIGLTTLAAYALESPIGVRGGAVYGCFSYLTGRPVMVLINGVLGVDEEKVITPRSVISSVAGFFAGNACAWALTNVALKEHDFSYPDALALGGTTAALATGVAVSVLCCVGGVMCCNSLHSKTTENPRSIV